jgi:hypothetical protein
MTRKTGARLRLGDTVCWPHDPRHEGVIIQVSGSLVWVRWHDSSAVSRTTQDELKLVKTVGKKIVEAPRKGCWRTGPTTMRESPQAKMVRQWEDRDDD